MRIQSTTRNQLSALAFGAILLGSCAAIDAANTPNWGAVGTAPGVQIQKQTGSLAPGAIMGSPAIGATGSAALPTGHYTLTLNPTSLQGGGFLPPSAHSAQLSTALTHNGSQLSLVVDGHVTLSGSVGATSVTASGQLPQGTLSLSGSPGSGGAQGTFHLSNGAGKTVIGNFSLAASAPTATAHMASNGDEPSTTDRILHWIFGDGGCGWFYKC